MADQPAPDGPPVTDAIHGRVLVATIADGKANAISYDVIAALNVALDRVEAAQGSEEGPGALLVTGSPGMLSGGFDLAVMRSGPKEAGQLVTQGGALFTRFYASSAPVVVACTGHAIAAGALLLLCADYRVGAAGEFRIGLIETQLGMVLPRWAVEMSAERLSRRHLQQATVAARIYDPVGACNAGFLDTVTEPDQVFADALAEAERLAALPPAAYGGQVKVNRGERLVRLDAAVAADRDLVFDVPQ